MFSRAGQGKRDSEDNRLLRTLALSCLDLVASNWTKPLFPTEIRLATTDNGTNAPVLSSCFRFPDRFAHGSRCNRKQEERVRVSSFPGICDSGRNSHDGPRALCVIDRRDSAGTTGARADAVVVSGGGFFPGSSTTTTTTTTATTTGRTGPNSTINEAS